MTATADAAQHLLRQTLGLFATGVTVITTRDAQGQALGLTCNSFNALSLDPPLVLWSLRRASASLPAFVAATHFAVHILGHHQEGLSRQFAGPAEARFRGVRHSAGLAGLPLLDGCAAWLECGVHSHQTVGDHELFIGRVLRHRRGESGPVLVFHGGQYTPCGLPQQALAA